MYYMPVIQSRIPSSAEETLRMWILTLHDFRKMAPERANESTAARPPSCSCSLI